MRHRLVTFAALAGAAALTACGGGAVRAPAAMSSPVPARSNVYAPDSLTRADYARAEQFLPGNLQDSVFGTRVSPTWLPDGRVWYRHPTPSGEQVVVVTPSTGDVERLSADDSRARALAPADTGWAASDDGRAWLRNAVVSPDGKWAAFLQDHDLWLRDLATQRDYPLTTNGEDGYGYATNNAGWVRSDRPVLRWSPDSRRIATFRHDARGVGRMVVAHTRAGHPVVDSWRYPLPEDTVIFRIERLVVDVSNPASPSVVRFKMPPDPHRSSVCDHVYCNGTFADLEWTPDGRRVAFVSTSRDHKRATLRVADAVTGNVRTVLEETSPTFLETGYDRWNWRLLPDSHEVIWYSRRDDWGKLYLYDLDSGDLKHAIGPGHYNVLDVLRVDPDTRTLWFVADGARDGNPYFTDFYRVSLDGGAPTLLTAESANHEISLSPDGRWFVDSYSTPTEPPATVLRDTRDGRIVARLEKADVSRLLAAGWQPPMPFTVKARDGKTDLYGLLFRPTRFDPSKKYPVINYVYPGPQSGSVSTWGWSAARRDHQSLAELGFVVVALNAMGGPMRTQSFQATYYGDMGDNGLPDQIAGIEQLAERYPWMDLDRVGIWGHSGGGFASTNAILRYPDFYKVAVSEAGNHDNRVYEDDWGEKWQGLLRDLGDGTTTYDNQANQRLAGNLKGKLLLAHGAVDDNVPYFNTLLVVQALIDANKDFDLIIFPDQRHGFAMTPYMIRRRWDYFVRNLLGAEPPAGYEIGAER